MNTYHIPVMAEEVVEGLRIEPGSLYIDATLGGGGHAWEVVKRGGKLLGIDADTDAITSARERLEFGCRSSPGAGSWILVQGNFRSIADIATAHGFTSVSGILMDLGVSSYQLDTPQKGFSYRFLDAPLDMRLDTTQGKSAAEFLKDASEGELYEIFTKYGEEERARAIVHALIRTRQIKGITSVGDVLESIDQAIGSVSDRQAIYSRIFQALRIYINEELQSLKIALLESLSILKPGGRLVVISFHSLEDRIVKQFMRRSEWKQISKKPITADEREIVINRRARSAKLRIVEKL